MLSSTSSTPWWQPALDTCDNLPRSAVSAAGLALSADPVPALPFHITEADGLDSAVKPVGWIRSATANEVLRYSQHEEADAVLRRCEGKAGRPFWCFTEEALRGGFTTMTAGLGQMAAYWRQKGIFSDALDGELPSLVI